MDQFGLIGYCAWNNIDMVLVDWDETLKVHDN
jgi:hypothetical protein